MHRIGVPAAALWLLTLITMARAYAQLEVTEVEGIAQQELEQGVQEGLSPEPCPLLTIAKGEHSGFHPDDPGFAGADFIIGEPDAWCRFWHLHTQNPDAPPPPVDFEHHLVIAAIQGFQETGCGPNISIVNVEREGPFARVTIIDDERPGPCDVITNPFHIVAAPRECLEPPGSVFFQHMRPFPESGTVVGRVFAAPPNEEPFPLFAAHVMLLREDHEPQHSTSGMDGSYFFANVEPGDYVLVAEHPDFQPVEAPIHVPPNTLVGHDFFLEPRPAGVIEGLVLGRHGDDEPFPLPDSLVQLFRSNEEVGRRYTNDGGHFVFEHVPVGEYVVRASHEGFVPQEFVAVVEPGGVVEHVFVLEPPAPPGAFAGRVMGVLDGDHHVPLPGALVRLFRNDEEVRRVHTDRRGRFIMRDVPPGVYMALAEKPGWLPADAEIAIEPGEVTQHIFLLQRGSEPSPAP